MIVKLNRWGSGPLAALPACALALACGCSSTPPAQAPAVQAQLTSADAPLVASAPRVGKSQHGIPDEALELSPKEALRNDRPSRRGSFGVSK